MVKKLTKILLAFMLLTAVEVARELHFFHVARYTVTSRKLTGIKGKKIIFLSDLHNYCYGRENEPLFRAIAKEKPDLILIGGDMLLRKDESSYGHTVKFLSRLPSICPVYHANGNHEQKMKERPKKYKRSFGDYKRRLEEAGIRFLARNRLRKADIEAKIGTSKDDYEILMAHHPAHIRAYRDWGADLILSGHYHGGVARIPGIGGVVAPDFMLFPEFSGGCYQVGDAVAVVSKGLGVHSVAVRLLNPAEVVVIELEGA